MKKPNILVYFSDQQRFDSLGCNGQKLPVTPELDKMAGRGINFQSAYTNQPVCGPARSMLQTGLYPTQTGCFTNGIALPQNIPTLATRLAAAGYETGYVGKWHLATTKGQDDYRTGPIPLKLRGGYTGFWAASDILEFTSHGYDGYVHDQDNRKRTFTGYRTNGITDFALEFLRGRGPDDEKPFFLFLSHIEPHHQNDRNQFEGPEGSKERFKDFVKPPELTEGIGDWASQMPDYLGCCRALDDNLGRVISQLAGDGLLDNTIIIYTSDHGCHFKSHMHELAPGGGDDYKRTCYENTIHIPLVITGPGFRGGRTCQRLVQLLDLPITIAAIAGADTSGMLGRDLRQALTAPEWEDEVYVQISESYTGRALRTKRYTYCVWSPQSHPGRDMHAPVYTERFLFDNVQDPLQKNNLVTDPQYMGLRQKLAGRLLVHAARAQEPAYQIKAAENQD